MLRLLWGFVRKLAAYPWRSLALFSASIRLLASSRVGVTGNCMAAGTAGGLNNPAIYTPNAEVPPAKN
jgi:hypothetical protein